MAVHVHEPRGVSGGGGFRERRHLAPVPEQKVPGRQSAERKASDHKVRGLAVWIMPADGQEIDDAVMARAAELVLAHALGIAPEAEVHWPAAGAPTCADGGTPVPPSDPFVDGTATETDDDGATRLPPSAGPMSRVAVDLAQREVLLDGKRVALTGVEFKLLRYLVENCSRAISRAELQRFLESWDSPGAAARSIDVYVGRVRRKLHGARHVVATVRGGGYQFVPGPAATVRGPAEYSI
ncbi:winged helix-turn-helix domain-containing protein [Pseudarthrobacter sp. N5]|uniref:winged helix-turn-helix domain-containing protein n=1 Tax=Pseudarthrobacter sp. N5 TaxID=3418416 RepID=UPI003CEF976A